MIFVSQASSIVLHSRQLFTFVRPFLSRRFAQWTGCPGQMRRADAQGERREGEKVEAKGGVQRIGLDKRWGLKDEGAKDRHSLRLSQRLVCGLVCG